MTVVEQPFTQTFDLRHYELDSKGKLSFPYLCRMLQESAGRHASTLSISSDLLREKGMTWVLSRFHVKRVDTKSQWPGWKQVITVQTWRAALERLFAIRDYRVLNESGDILAVAVRERHASALS
jgi:medium-chain acyl-[acyl-carrier-protein] hydrolase